jgi:hypothetical protein
VCAAVFTLLVVQARAETVVPMNGQTPELMDSDMAACRAEAKAAYDKALASASADTTTGTSARSTTGRLHNLPIQPTRPASARAVIHLSSRTRRRTGPFGRNGDAAGLREEDITRSGLAITAYTVHRDGLNINFINPRMRRKTRPSTSACGYVKPLLLLPRAHPVGDAFEEVRRPRDGLDAPGSQPLPYLVANTGEC